MSSACSMLWYFSRLLLSWWLIEKRFLALKRLFPR